MGCPTQSQNMPEAKKRQKKKKKLNGKKSSLTLWTEKIKGKRKKKKFTVFPNPVPSALNICSPNNGNAKPSNERKS